MADFCTCGSIVINGHCTNKNCTSKSTAKAASPKVSGSRTSLGTDTKKAAKPPKTKRASKCIVYNLYDKKEENIE